MIVNFIKCVEKDVQKSGEQTNNEIRNQTTPIIKRLFLQIDNLDHNKKTVIA